MTRINLLPPEQRDKASRDQGILLVVLGLVAVILVLGAVYFLTLQKVNTKEDELKVTQEQVDATSREVAALQPYEELEQQKVDMSATVKELYDSRVVWSAILEEISLVIPEKVSLTTMDCKVPANMLAGSALVHATEVRPEGINFTGEASSFRDVGEFIVRLGLLPQLMNPRLISMTVPPPTPGQPEFVQFQVEVFLRPFAVPAPASAGSTAAPAPTPTEGAAP